MAIRNLLAVLLIGFSVSGCISLKSYVDPKYSSVDYEDIVRVEDLYDARVEIEFQRNGEHLPAVDATLRTNVERILRASGVIVPVNEGESIVIKIICNNIGSAGGAAVKGFGTGLTFGLVGTSVSDNYRVTIEIVRGDEVIERSYDHAIHSTVGNKSAPVEGVTAMSAGDAFSKVVEDVILQFIQDMQSINLLTMNQGQVSDLT